MCDEVEVPEISKHTFLGTVEDGDILVRAYMPKFAAGGRQTLVAHAYYNGALTGSREIGIDPASVLGIGPSDAIKLSGAIDDLIEEVRNDANHSSV